MRRELHRGRWLLLHWYQHLDGEAVRGITVLELDGDRIARLVNYFFSSDFLVDVCGELGVPVRVTGHRWGLPEPELERSPAVGRARGQVESAQRGGLEVPTRRPERHNDIRRTEMHKISKGSAIAPGQDERVVSPLTEPAVRTPRERTRKRANLATIGLACVAVLQALGARGRCRR